LLEKGQLVEAGTTKQVVPCSFSSYAMMIFQIKAMKVQERIETVRLVLRKATLADAAAVFQRYASDREVTKFLSWRCHQSIEETRAFLEYSEREWAQSASGAYLIESRESARLLGSTGLHFQTPVIAITGYVLAKDAWGYGYATEALNAILELARTLGVRSLRASSHGENIASMRVLEKCGFVREKPDHYVTFPNLGPIPVESLGYVRTF
jgi:ribosomal-protein-alanine N-acetyltransferase